MNEMDNFKFFTGATITVLDKLYLQDITLKKE